MYAIEGARKRCRARAKAGAPAAARQPKLRQIDAVQRADGRPRQNGQLARRHRRRAGGCGRPRGAARRGRRPARPVLAAHIQHGGGCCEPRRAGGRIRPRRVRRRRTHPAPRPRARAAGAGAGAACRARRHHARPARPPRRLFGCRRAVRAAGHARVRPLRPSPRRRRPPAHRSARRLPKNVPRSRRRPARFGPRRPARFRRRPACFGPRRLGCGRGRGEGRAGGLRFPRPPARGAGGRKRARRSGCRGGGGRAARRRGRGAARRRVRARAAALRPRRQVVFRSEICAAAVCRHPSVRLFPRLRARDAGHARQRGARRAARGGGRSARRGGGGGGRARRRGVFALAVRLGGHAALLPPADRPARTRTRPARGERPALGARLPHRRHLPPRRADRPRRLFAADGLRLHRRRHFDDARAGKQAAAAAGDRRPRLRQLRGKAARLPRRRLRLFRPPLYRRRRAVCGGRAARLCGGAAAAPPHPRRGDLRARTRAPAMSAPAPRAPFLAFFGKTVYNKGRNGGHRLPHPAVGAALLRLFARLCGGGQRRKHPRPHQPRPRAALLADGRGQVANRAGGAVRPRRQRERRGHPRPILRRPHRRLHARIRRRLFGLYLDLLSLCLRHRGRGAGDGRPPRAAPRRRADGHRLFALLPRVRAALLRRACRLSARARPAAPHLLVSETGT